MKNRLHPYKVSLGEQAHVVLIAMVKRNSIEPEHILRAICETDLYDASNDSDVAETIAYDANLLKTTGGLDGRYWEHDRTRHDGFLVDRAEGQEEAPDDVPVYQPPDSYGRFHIPLDLSAGAFAGVVLLKEYGDHCSLEKTVRATLVNDVKSLAASEAFAEWIDAQFDQGE